MSFREAHLFPLLRFSVNLKLTKILTNCFQCVNFLLNLLSGREPVFGVKSPQLPSESSPDANDDKAIETFVDSEAEEETGNGCSYIFP